jgi:antitoxin component YwqK of YwqJK toxin-antitoxin module
MVQLRRIAFSLCCALAFAGCAEKIDARQLQRDNGLSYKRGSDDPFTGTVTNVPIVEFGFLGKGDCTAEMKKGLVHGKVSCEVEDGAPRYEARFREGEKDGEERVWNTETDTMVTSVEWENGRRNGVEQHYHPEHKKLLSEIHWNKDKKEGRERHWNLAGEEVLVDLMWSNGKHTGFDKRGEWDVNFVDGQYDGVRRNYAWADVDSGMRFLRDTELQKQMGGAVWAGAYSGNVVGMEQTWARGVQLTEKRWYTTGKLRLEKTYKDGEHAATREWREDGSLDSETYFQHGAVNLGSVHGEQVKRTYDGQGKLMRTECYLKDCSDVDRMFPAAKTSTEPVAAAVTSEVTSVAAAASGDDVTGECVFPKTRSGTNGNLELVQPITVYAAARKEGGSALSNISSYVISAQNAGLAQISDPETKQPVGWVDIAGFEFVHRRNC